MANISKINVGGVEYDVRDKNAVVTATGYKYTLKCGDTCYTGEVNARFIAGDKIYNRMRGVEPDYDNTYEPYLVYDGEVAFVSGSWVLPNEVVFIDPLTDAEKELVNSWTLYDGSYDGEVDVFMCGDQFLGMADNGNSGAKWNLVKAYCWDFPGHIDTPLYEISCFDGISTKPGVYSIRLRYANNILANFTMVCNGDISVNGSIYSTPCYCTELNKMVMLKMTHHKYEGDNGGGGYYEDHHLITVVDLNGNDVTQSVIELHSYEWVYDNYDGSFGGLEYIQLA